MKFALLLFWFLLNPLSILAKPAAPVFRFQLLSEPLSLNPAQLSSGLSHYLFSQIFEGLYGYDNEQGLVARGAKECRWQSPLRLVCQLDPQKKFNDGSPVLASHYQQAFQHLINPKSHAPSAEMLFALQNARQIFAGKIKPESLGLEAPNPHLLIFRFAEADADFLYKLSSPALIPWKELPDYNKRHRLIVNGPYQISHWQSQKIRLRPNPFYQPKPPALELEAVVIDDSQTALNLYDTGKLDFISRLPASQIRAFAKRSDFVQAPMARFDYLGLGGDLSNQEDLRKAMAYALDYEEFQRNFHSLGRAGCPSLPESYFTDYPCYSFDLKKAKTYMDKVPESIRKKPRKIYYASAGGEVIKETMEWFQGQWKKHLGLDFELQGLEYKWMQSELRKGIDGVFRKGIPIDRPSCLAGLENFATDAPENFLHIRNQALDKSIAQLRTAIQGNQPKLCSLAVQQLLQEHRYIPLGRIHFSMIVRPEFRGWRINELNHLDLRQLQWHGSDSH